jgi:hypothetical protein
MRHLYALQELTDGTFVKNNKTYTPFKMDINTYEQQFQAIADGQMSLPPYDNEAYLNYAKLNNSRLKRWYKIGKITPELTDEIKAINSPQEWLLITEPWCGDAAHTQPFIAKLAALNPMITLTVQNRDAPNSEIENYLTNGGKSIPKLVVRDATGSDLLSWGPRPKAAQAIHLSQINSDTLSPEEKKVELQNWYNKDKGAGMQAELLSLFEEKLVATKNRIYN